MNKVIALILLLSLSSVLQAAPVTGRIQSKNRGTAVVYAEPLDARRVQPGRFTVTQKNKSFTPRLLAVPVGSTVSFPNNDVIFHNVFSLSRPNPFDLGLYRDGQSKDRTFTAAAVYRVFCNIHPQMSATILVVPSSYITEADNTGAYRFDLPAGRYRITAWNERAGEPTSVEITVGAPVQIAPVLMLNETQAADAQHKNKFGQSYPASAYDPMKH